MSIRRHEVESDAHKVMRVLQERFAKFGLTIHPNKSKMLHFRWTSRDTVKKPHRQFRLLRFYSLLGEIEEWSLGCKAENHEKTPSESDA